MPAFDPDMPHLEFILEMIRKAQRKCDATTQSDFIANEDEIELMAFRLSQIGESCGKLSSELKARYPEIPWPQVSGMRNIIVHDYMRLMAGRIWLTATGSLEPLLKMCLAELSGDEP